MGGRSDKNDYVPLWTRLYGSLSSRWLISEYIHHTYDEGE